MELIREAEWIITCFLKRVVCSRLLWSGLFIGYVYNLNKAAEFCHAAPGDDAGQVPGGLQTPPPPRCSPGTPSPTVGAAAAHSKASHQLEDLEHLPLGSNAG